MGLYDSGNGILMNTEFNKLGLIKKGSLTPLYNALSGKGFANFFKNWFNSPMDALTSLRVYPINFDSISKGGQYLFMYIGNEQYNVPYFKLDKLENKLIGEFEYQPEYFTDLEPYASVQCYIPYMNFIDLPISEIANKLLVVRYAIDFTTGFATVNFEVNSGSHRYLIASKSSQIGIDIPYGKTNVSEIIKNAISTVASDTIGLIASGGASVGSAGKDAVSLVNQSVVKYQRGGNISTMISTIMPLRPYIIITKPKLVPVDETVYAHTYGKPLYETRVLSTMRGFTIVDDIHLENFPTATSGELDEIERLLKSGVHL